MLLKAIDISLVVRFPLDFHKVPYSPEYYVTVYFVFAHWVTFLHTSPELWKRRPHESVLFVIQLGRPWSLGDVPGRGRPNWNLLCWYLRIVPLALLGLRWSKQAICLWDIPQLYRARMDPPFCPGKVLRCVHSQNTETQALLSPLQWVSISRRWTLPVLWLRSWN